eukprot:754968-Hanusia_phi.AAC.3
MGASELLARGFLYMGKRRGCNDESRGGWEVGEGGGRGKRGEGRGDWREDSHWRGWERRLPVCASRISWQWEVVPAVSFVGLRRRPALLLGEP